MSQCDPGTIVRQPLGYIVPSNVSQCDPETIVRQPLGYRYSSLQCLSVIRGL